jgi:hypothetical protein
MSARTTRLVGALTPKVEGCVLLTAALNEHPSVDERH